MYTSYFPTLPNYENLLKATNTSIGALLLFLKYLLFLNQQGTSARTFFMDSTAISVCENPYIASHQAARDFAARGKNCKGWFYGFKLHERYDRHGTLLNVLFTLDNVYDNQVSEELTMRLEGLFVVDAGYLLKVEEFQRLYERAPAYLAWGEEEHEAGDEQGTETTIPGSKHYRDDLGCSQGTVSIGLSPCPKYDRTISALSV
jgi:hypothetical protein